MARPNLRWIGHAGQRPDLQGPVTTSARSVTTFLVMSQVLGTMAERVADPSERFDHPGPGALQPRAPQEAGRGAGGASGPGSGSGPFSGIRGGSHGCIAVWWGTSFGRQGAGG
jgi:hypothetical protein